MPGLPMLRAPLAANAPAHPLDVVWLKSALQALGHYQAPDWGISPYPDRALFDAVRAFQDDRGLAADGSLKPGGATWSALTDRLDGEAGPQTLRAAARALQSLGRGGDTILAHITPEEARLLKTLGGSGTINPATGLMEFWGRLGGSTFERERAAKAALREASTTRALEKRQRSGDWDATRGRTLGYNDFNPGGLHGDKNRDGSPKDAEGLDRHKRAVEQNEAKALAKAGVHALPERLYAHATITPTDPRRRRGKGLNADATMVTSFGLGGDGGLFTQVSDERAQELDTLGEDAFTKTPDKAEQARIAGRILGLTDEPGQRTLKSHATLAAPSWSSITAATGPEAKPSFKPKPKTTRTVSPAHQALEDKINAKIVANRARVKNYLDEADAMKADGLKMTADNRAKAWTKATQNLLDYEGDAYLSNAHANLTSSAVGLSGKAMKSAKHALRGHIATLATASGIDPEHVESAGALGTVALAGVIGERYHKNDARYKGQLANVLDTLRQQGHHELVQELTRLRADALVDKEWAPVTMTDEELESAINTNETISYALFEIGAAGRFSPASLMAGLAMAGFANSVDKMRNELRRRNPKANDTP